MTKYRLQIDPEHDYSWAFVILALCLVALLLRFLIVLVPVALFALLVWWLIRFLRKEDEQ